MRFSKSTIYNSLLVFFLAIICVSGNGFLNWYKMEYIYIITVLLLFGQHSRYTSIYKSDLKYCLPAIFILVSLGWSISKNDTLLYLGLYCFGVCVILRKYDDKFYNYLLKIFKYVALAVAASILLSVLIPRLASIIIGIFMYPISPGNATQKALIAIQSGSYYGISGEKAKAAFAMAIGLIIYICEYFLGKKMKRTDLGCIIILLVSLMLTGKRMEFLVPIVFFLLVFFIMRGKNKFAKLCGIVLVGIIVLFILPYIVPQTSLVINRFLDSGSDNFVNGRDVLWEYALEMFRDNPLVGQGYGTYNHYIDNTSFVAYTGESEWNYHAHSIYFQIIGECGIVGILIWLSIYIGTFVKLIVKLRKKSFNEYTLYAVGFLVLILFYGLSANTLYYIDELVFSFVALVFARKSLKIAPEGNTEDVSK
ncbi:MAG: O-antigen ligase family protein [Lachnospiraceae bacterium]|nr:O-antigen ligase family protein [Lachnospiraceae bacterium]